MKKERISFSSEQRHHIFSKTRFHCARCGEQLHLNNKWSTVDHIVPLRSGGVDEDENYIGLCYSCNRLKGKNIILPTAFYDNLKHSNYILQLADKVVLDWQRDNMPNKYFYNNPLLFHEVKFSIDSQSNKDIRVFFGNRAKHIKSITMYKLYKSEIPVASPELHCSDPAKVLNEAFANGYCYVMRNNRKGCIDAVMNVVIKDNVVSINVTNSEHYKTTGIILYTYVSRIKDILIKKGVKAITLEGLTESALNALLEYAKPYGDVYLENEIAYITTDIGSHIADIVDVKGVNEYDYRSLT